MAEILKDQMNFFDGIFEEGEENEDELKNDYLDKIQETVTWSSDWTVETINNQINKGSIELTPTFQRRDAWDKRKKSKLIESILLGFPIPQIVLAEDKKSKGKFVVVDGKQRLTAINQFLNGQYKLQLPQNKLLNNLNKDELEKKLPEYYGVFLNQTIRSVILKNWPSENFLYTLFYRLNTGSLPLSPQELRRALKPGHLIEFLADYSENSPGIKKIFKSKQPDPRMKDVELLLRYISFEVGIDKYDGDLKVFLDKTCDLFNMDWPAKSDYLNSLCQKYETVVDRCFSVFGENAFKKYSNDGYEARFNRAVFDIQMYYFGLPAIETLVEQKAKGIEEMYREICSKNETFSTSISVNTMNLMNFSTRFVLFGNELERVLQVADLKPKQIIEIFKSYYR